MKANTGVFVVFKTKRELECQFSGITEILWCTFWRNNWRSVFDVVKILRLLPHIQDAGSFVNCSKVQTPFSLGYIMKGFSYLLWWLCPVIQGEESASFGILLASTCCPENHVSATLTSLTRSQKPRLIKYKVHTFLDTGYLFSQLNIFFSLRYLTQNSSIWNILRQVQTRIRFFEWI